MGDAVSVVLTNRLPEIQRLNGILEHFAQQHQLSQRVVYPVNLALDEILTNVISYGYQDSGEHQIQVRISLDAEVLTAEVEDDGRPFNPLERADPDLDASAEDRPIGGLGIYLLKTMLDSVEYRNQGGRNLLVMKKRVTPTQPRP